MSDFEAKEYKYGFATDIATETLPKGLTEQRVREISEKKGEPTFVLDFRLKAFEKLQTQSQPTWGHLSYTPIDVNDIVYYSAPKNKPQLDSLEDADPELLKTFQRLGIPLEEQKRIANVAVDVVYDSVSLGTTFKEKLEEAGVVLCSISEAFHRYPHILEEHLGSVVPIGDNYFATLNSAVFTDGSFVYVPKGVRCPIELSTYFRINDKNSGQFERTLIVAEPGSYVSYLEGCTAPSYDTNQLHAAVVELVAKEDAEIKYSTVQNWYPGDPKTGKGGIYNFVTKRAVAHARAKVAWTQVEAGAAITWKYPSVILRGDDSVGEFYSVALTNGHMQADTGTKMLHLGNRTSSTIISKGISADRSHNTYRGQVIMRGEQCKNYTQCDSMLVGNSCSANTFPDIQVDGDVSQVEHEASTCGMDEERLFFLEARGLSREQAIELYIKGYCGDVIEALPFEFAQEAHKLLALKLENSVG